MVDDFIGQPVKGHTDEDNGEDAGKGDRRAAAGSAGVNDKADAVFSVDLLTDGDVSPADAVHHGEGLQDTGQGTGEQHHGKKLKPIHTKGAGSEHKVRADLLKGEDHAGQHVDEGSEE